MLVVIGDDVSEQLEIDGGQGLAPGECCLNLRGGVGDVWDDVEWHDDDEVLDSYRRLKIVQWVSGRIAGIDYEVFVARRSFYTFFLSVNLCQIASSAVLLPPLACTGSNQKT